VYRYVNIK